MDKGKGLAPGLGGGLGGAKRGPKGKVLPPASDNLIALGTGSASSASGASSSSGAKSMAGKREGGVTSSQVIIPAKKAKLITQKGVELWEESIIEVEPYELVARVLEAEEVNNEDRIESYLCGAVKQLKQNRMKPDACLNLSLIYLAKSRPYLFCSETSVEAFCSVLKRDAGFNFKAKGNNQASVLSANILLAAFREETCWPKVFIKVFVEDSLGDRNWVDSEECKGFVDNILTGFNTKMPPKSLMTQDIVFGGTATAKGQGESPASSSPSHPMITDDSPDEGSSSFVFASDLKDRLGAEIAITQRYANNQDFVNEFVTEAINDQLNRRQVPSEINRNMLRLLIATVGIQQIRLAVAQRLEIWLQNPKLTRPAQDLLLAICMNCNENDIEVISLLVKMRLKTKPLINHFVVCIKELLGLKEENMNLVLRQAILNEISSTRGANNMQLVSVAFQYSSEKATRALALLFHELLLKDDCLRTLRQLLREIIRTLRHDHINLVQFVATLADESPFFLEMDPNDFIVKERILTCISDIITLCMFLSVSPAVREAISTSKTDRKDIMRAFQLQVAEMQRLCVYWMHTVVPKLFKPERTEFMHCLNKLLFMESADQYHSKDNWPPENDRNFLFRMCSEVPLVEDTSIRLLNMGLSKDHHVTPPEAIELSDTLIKRASSVYDGNLHIYPVLLIQKEEIFSLLLKCASYRIPENITLPVGYEAPSMAISDWYWKVWIQLVILTAHNPTAFGIMAWERYPTLSLLVEMTITNHFEFPPPTRQMEDYKSRELQIQTLEKQQILQFESHLAAASTKMQITENNSLLLSKLITFDPHGSPRKPPSSVLDQLKSINAGLKLGHLLCQSRDPDFLLEIIQRQQKQSNPNQACSGPISMPWLNDLVETNEDNLSMLPVQCLCEFLLGQVNEETLAPFLQMESIKHSEKVKSKKDKKRKQMKLIGHLQYILQSDRNLAQELIEYFMKRLSFQQTAFRGLASTALDLVLTANTSDEELFNFNDISSDIKSWLIDKFPLLDHFESLKTTACKCLRSASLVDTNPESVCRYIQFLASYGNADDADMILDVAHLLIDRCIITRYFTQQSEFRECFLTSTTRLFHEYLKGVKKPEGEMTYDWSSAQDHILVQWSNGEGAILNILVVHAMMLLLTFGPAETEQDTYDELLNTWFSNPPPQSFLVDTSEEALLIPDWLKLKLIRSLSPQLADAALKDLESAQLVLFIQSFGLPVCNMEKLLNALDYCCQTDEEAVRASIPDEKFMRHLIEVQWMRGVKAGYKFANMLGIETPPQDGAEDQPMATIKIEKDADETPSESDALRVSISEWLNQRDKYPSYLSSYLKAIPSELISKKMETQKVITDRFVSQMISLLNDKSQSSLNSRLITSLNGNDLNSLLINIATLAPKCNDEVIISRVRDLGKLLCENKAITNAPIKRIFERYVRDNVSAGESNQKKVRGEGSGVMLQKRTLSKANAEICKSIADSVHLEHYQQTEPELINAEAFLFTDNRSYLLPLLIHKTSFSTLTMYVNKLLSSEAVEYNPSPVLNFLAACLDSPRLWAGRDKKKPKHFLWEDVLKLREPQIIKLVDYILKEGCIEKRMPLLLRTCCFSKTHIDAIVDKLTKMSENEDDQQPKTLPSELLFRLYLQVPALAYPFKITHKETTIGEQQPSLIDKVIHTLLTSFTNIELASRSVLMTDCELALIKLASKHPSLFLRHLPMIASLLSGRSGLVKYYVFKQRNYLSVYNRFLNILSSLKEDLFVRPPLQGLKQVFSCYLEVFVSYHYQAKKDLLPFLSKFMVLVNDWLRNDPESAKSWIKSNNRILQEMCNVYPESMILKSVTSGVYFQNQPFLQQYYPQQVAMRLQQAADNGEELRLILMDLDKLADKEPQILEYFLDELKRFIGNPYTSDITFKLIFKLLKSKPSLADSLVHAYCQSLETDSALENLPDIVTFAQEHRSLILQKAFEVGVSRNPSAAQYICEAFSLLNLQI